MTEIISLTFGYRVYQEYRRAFRFLSCEFVSTGDQAQYDKNLRNLELIRTSNKVVVLILAT